MPGVALDEAGRGQAARLGTALATHRPNALFTSPMSRARATAIAIETASGLAARPCDALNEIDFGEWTGASFADLAGDPAWSRWNSQRSEARPPGGEPMYLAQARVVAGIQRMRAALPDGKVVAVSHADIIKAALLWCLGLTLDAHMRLDIDPASISAMVLWEDGGKVLWINQGVTA
ncbi:histidine phosphatase family protein [Dankookia sp. P2]|uniref:histidine phosphatase family protein n=1 Tax=Dankookia sp. P2 TaxID=3423955 RepID=UPI003D67B533